MKGAHVPIISSLLPMSNLMLGENSQKIAKIARNRFKSYNSTAIFSIFEIRIFRINRHTAAYVHKIMIKPPPSESRLKNQIQIGSRSRAAFFPTIYYTMPKNCYCFFEKLYVPTEVNTLQVDRLARISGLTHAPYKSHPQPLNSVPRSPTSDPPKHQHSRQSRVLSTNTQESQGERKGEGVTHERFGS